MLALSIVIVLISLCGSSAFQRARLTTFAKRFGSRGVLRPLGNWATPPVDTDTKEHSTKLTYTDILASEYQVDETDYEKLKSDDPRFVRMEVPSDRGPLATAYTRHMRWRQKLKQHDLERWGEWAVVSNYKDTHPDQFNLHDFVVQRWERELYDNVLKGLKKNDTEAVLEFSSLACKFEQKQADDVQKALHAYYTAFNIGNLGTIRSYWLQDPSSELILPGFAKARGGHKIDQLYQRFLEGFHGHMGLVKVKVAAVHVHGNLAVAHTVEEVGEPAKNHFTPARMKFKASEVVKPRVLATTIMRRIKDRWFILCHHAVRMDSSPFTGDHLEIRFTPEDARQRAAKMTAFLAPLEAVEGGDDAASPTPEAQHQIKEQAVQDPRGSTDPDSGPVKAVTATDATPGTAQAPPQTKTWSKSAKPPAKASPTASSLTTEVSAPGAAEGRVHSGSSKEPGIKGSSSRTKGTGSNSSASSKSAVVDMAVTDGAQGPKEKAENTAITQNIDPSQPLSKQAVQALKLLVKQGRISNKEKDVLIADLVTGLSVSGSSAVQVAYEMLCGPATALKDTDDMAAHLSDFADQCGVLLRSRGARTQESNPREDEKNSARSC